MSVLLEVDLAGAGPGSRPVRAVESQPLPAPFATLGGAAAVLPAFVREAQRDPAAPGPLALFTGRAVRRGVPTAARATVLARSPSGLPAWGEVGGEFGPRLAALGEGVLVRGRSGLRGAVLVIEGDGSAHLEAHPALLGLSLPERVRALREVLATRGLVVAGPAADRGLPFATLANAEEPPAHTGRSGLGAAFAARGLLAIAVRAEPAPAVPDDPLRQALAASPRLAARADGGSLEVFHALAARGREGPAQAARWAEVEPGAPRRGCRGCPTPCGVVLERPGGGAGGARFGSLVGLAGRLGLERREEALALLAACDAAGADALEIGAALEVALRAREAGRLAGGPRRGAAEELLAWARAIALGEPPAAAFVRGAAAAERAFGLEPRVASVRGRALRPLQEPAALLLACVCARGAGGLAGAPFLAAEGAARARIAELIAPLPAPPGIEEPSSPLAKGRLVWWHENLAAALDASGFCAFSAAGLLADGLFTLDELAARLVPQWSSVPDAGRRLLAVGAGLVLLARRLEELWGAPAGRDLPPFARERLSHPSLWPEYRRLRGLDEDGEVLPEVLGAIGETALLDRSVGGCEPTRLAAARPRALPAREREDRRKRALRGEGRAAGREQPVGERGIGCGERDGPSPEGWGSKGAAAAPGASGTGGGLLHLGAVGPLARALGEPRLALAGAVSVAQVLERLSRERPAARRWLGPAGARRVAVYRAGLRLGEDDLVHPGERLEIVLALSGG